MVKGDKANSGGWEWASVAPGLLLVVATVAVVILVGLVSLRRELTPLEAGLLQSASLIVGTAATFYVGRLSAQKAGREYVEISARSAIRRVILLYQAIGRYSTRIEVERQRLELRIDSDGLIRWEHVSDSLELLNVQIGEQIPTASDAIEGWRDLVPDLVDEALRRAKEQRDGE